MIARDHPDGRRRTLAAGLALLALLGSLVTLVPAAGGLLPGTPLAQDPLAIDVHRILEPPTPEHWLGTDQLGRDLLARLLRGGRSSFLAGLVATALAMALGLVLGGAAGWAPGWLDALLSRCTDVAYAFPALIGALALLSLPLPDSLEGLPQGARVGAVVGLFSWPVLFRFLRAEVRRLAVTDLRASATACGAGFWRTLLRHIMPSALEPALVPASFIAAGTIFAEAALGFLGLGVLPPQPSWGNLLRDGMLHLDRAWWLVLFPGTAVFAAVLAFQLLGEGLRKPGPARSDLP